MPAAWEQYLEAEAALTQAIKDARGATKDLHRAVKDQRASIEKMIADEVTAQVVEILASVRRNAEARIVAVIDEIRDDWRRKLGL